MPNSTQFRPASVNFTIQITTSTTQLTKPVQIMSGIGAELPPHLLAKRKRQQEEQTNVASTTDSGAKSSPSPDGPEKRRKVIGPAMPPAPLEERPEQPPDFEEEESSDDDDFGPSLPTGDAVSPTWPYFSAYLLTETGWR